MIFKIPYKQKLALDKLVESTGREFTLWGKTKIDGENVTLIDLRIPEQESTTGSTNLEGVDTDKFLEELIKDKEGIEHWNCWIHSHNTMGAFWSLTDQEQMQSFKGWGVSYFFHLVVSTEDFKCACSMFKPFTVIQEDIEIEYLEPLRSDVRKKHIDLYVEKSKLEARLGVVNEELEEELEKEPKYVKILKKELEKKNKEYKPKKQIGFIDNGQYDDYGDKSDFRDDKGVLWRFSYVKGSYVKVSKEEEAEEWEKYMEEI